MEGGKLWDQDQPKLVSKLRAALKLGEAYQKQYRAAWEGPGSPMVCLGSSSGHMKELARKKEAVASKFVRRQSLVAQMAIFDGLIRMYCGHSVEGCMRAARKLAHLKGPRFSCFSMSRALWWKSHEKSRLCSIDLMTVLMHNEVSGFTPPVSDIHGPEWRGRYMASMLLVMRRAHLPLMRPRFLGSMSCLPVDAASWSSCSAPFTNSAAWHSTPILRV